MRRVVQCCYTVPSHGYGRVRAYVAGAAGSDRILIRIYNHRSRRWVCKWEDRGRLDDFRIKTLPQRHPCYEDSCIVDAVAVAGLVRGTE